MKKISIVLDTLFIVGLLLISCNKSPELKQEEDFSFPIITSEGCEYFKEQTYAGYYIYIHKGNCKNPIHYFKTNNLYKYNIVLPDDYPLISTDENKKDTLTAYVSRDTIYFQLLNDKIK